jgi:hypothetical protein
MAAAAPTKQAARIICVSCKSEIREGHVDKAVSPFLGQILTAIGVEHAVTSRIHQSCARNLIRTSPAASGVKKPKPNIDAAGGTPVSRPSSWRRPAAAEFIKSSAIIDAFATGSNERHVIASGQLSR